MHIHPVFYVGLLEPHVANTFPNRVVALPLPTEVNGLPQFEVKTILNCGFFYRKHEVPGRLGGLRSVRALVAAYREFFQCKFGHSRIPHHAHV